MNLLKAITLENIFALGGLALIFVGIIGGHKVKVDGGPVEFAFGPINKTWRLISVGVGLFIIVGVGYMALHTGA